MSKIKIENISLSFGDHKVLKDISFEIESNQVIAMIGPSGCGKSTLLYCINRLHDPDEATITGNIYLEKENIYDDSTDVNLLRQKVGMVFQRPNPFPKSIKDNVAFGLNISGEKDKGKIDNIVESSLRDSYLWEEVDDKLSDSALALSGGQQQRLCIARCLANSPEVILMDEPTSALDPIGSKKIEDLILKLKKDYTIIIVTHSMQQAKRIADKIAFMYLGDLIEFTDTKSFFENPQNELSRKYVSGEFG